MVGNGIELNIMPVVTTTWGQWRAQHPDSKVLAPDTGFARDYTPNSAYGDYFSSPNLMFPALTPDERLDQKDQVFGLRISGAEKAWPLTSFTGGRVINDRIGTVNLVVVGDAASRSVRAYRSGGRQFEKLNDDLKLIAHNGQSWKVSESDLIGPDGETLSRLPGHLPYWFAWSNYLEKADFFTE